MPTTSMSTTSTAATHTHSGRSYTLPPLGNNPGAGPATTPGSMAHAPRIAPGPRGALTFSSPDAPGMPAPSDKTAWDFLPEGWSTQESFPTSRDRQGAVPHAPPPVRWDGRPARQSAETADPP